MSRPLPSWTPAQAIQVQRKYVSSDYNISATQRFVFFPPTDLAMCFLSLRCTSIVGWKSARMTLIVRSVVPSFVSIPQYT